MTLRLGLILAAVLAVSAGAAWIYARGGADATDARALHDATENIKGTDDARESTGTVPVDPDGLLRWLRGVAEE